MLVFKKETFEDLYRDGHQLMFDHFKEVFPFNDEMNIDLEYFMAAQEFGMLNVYIARDEGQLIGYALFIVKPGAHTLDVKHAYQDSIFIKKDRRGFGTEFIKWCDDQLKEEGVKVVFHYVKVDHDWSKILNRLGYVKTDTLYAKRLDA